MFTPHRRISGPGRRAIPRVPWRRAAWDARRQFTRPLLRFAVAAVLVVLCAGTSRGQRVVDSDAVAGEPLGVGRIALEIVAGPAATPSLSEQDGRVLYTAADARPLARLFPRRRNRTRDIYFLFIGDAPLSLTVAGERPQTVAIETRNDATARRAMLSSWWRAFTADQRPLATRPPDGLRDVDIFVRAMLARRLSLRMPRPAATPGRDGSLLALLSEREKVRQSRLRLSAYDRRGLTVAASEPVPRRPSLPEAPPLDAKGLAEVQVEEMAHYVPAECFYIRFGTFGNYKWLRRTSESLTGTSQNLLAMRALDYDVRARMERRLAVNENFLARLLGEAVVADLAIVGLDVSFRDGAAMGILLEAKNNTLLGTALMQQRRFNMIGVAGARHQQVAVAGREVSFISSPDETIRSYYAAYGNFHLVTASERLMARFLEAAEGKGALADLAEFRDARRDARRDVPASDGQSLFVYLSRPFLQGLVAPQRWVESRRREQAAIDCELVELARLAAIRENKSSDEIDGLIEAGLLPRNFGQRPDGSRTLLAEGVVRDSLRGARGAFVPASDVTVDKVTPAEARGYRELVDDNIDNWRRFEPILVSLARTQPQAEQPETVSIEARVGRLTPPHLQMLVDTLAPLSATRVEDSPADLISGELALGGQRIFIGLRDASPRFPGPLAQLQGLLPLANLGPAAPLVKLLTTVRGYVGVTPGPGILGGVAHPDASRDAAGFSRGPLGMWQLAREDMLVASFHRDVLDDVASRLRVAPSERKSQARLRVRDLSGSKLEATLEQAAAERARRVSEDNARFLDRLSTDFGVAPQEALTVAERVLDAKLLCPLGGEFHYRDAGQGDGRWESTAWDRETEPLGLVKTIKHLEIEARLEDAVIRIDAQAVLRRESAPEVLPPPE